MRRPRSAYPRSAPGRFVQAVLEHVDFGHRGGQLEPGVLERGQGAPGRGPLGEVVDGPVQRGPAPAPSSRPAAAGAAAVPRGARSRRPPGRAGWPPAPGRRRRTVRPCRAGRPCLGGAALRRGDGPDRAGAAVKVRQRARPGLCGCRLGQNGPPKRDVGPQCPLVPRVKAENNRTAPRMARVSSRRPGWDRQAAGTREAPCPAGVPGGRAGCSARPADAGQGPPAPEQVEPEPCPGRSGRAEHSGTARA